MEPPAVRIKETGRNDLGFEYLTEIEQFHCFAKARATLANSR
jgi:hypothetical protein